MLQNSVSTSDPNPKPQTETLSLALTSNPKPNPRALTPASKLKEMPDEWKRGGKENFFQVGISFLKLRCLLS